MNEINEISPDEYRFFAGEKNEPVVYYPREIEASYQGPVYGYYIEESNAYNIVGYEGAEVEMGGKEPVCLGKVCADQSPCVEGLIEGCREAGALVFRTAAGERCKNEPYQLKMDIFSRNTGILESDVMLKKGAVIIGCGSVGSLVALELARAGVGRFFLIDKDIFGYHNICRHQCGVQDVGKYKTTAVKERILQINPSATVVMQNKMVQEVPLALFDTFCNPDTIMIGCADNRQGDLYADSVIAKAYGMSFVSIGCWERAFAGEIFYCLPDGMPAYQDLYDAVGASTARVEANHHIYSTETDLEKLNFEPGISADINFITTIAVKLILDLLNLENYHFTPRVVEHLSQLTLICNTNDPKIGGDKARYFDYPLQVRTDAYVAYSNPPDTGNASLQAANTEQD